MSLVYAGFTASGGGIPAGAAAAGLSSGSSGSLMPFPLPLVIINPDAAVNRPGSIPGEKAPFDVEVADRPSETLYDPDISAAKDGGLSNYEIDLDLLPRLGPIIELDPMTGLPDPGGIR